VLKVVNLSNILQERFARASNAAKQDETKALSMLAHERGGILRVKSIQSI
jgi:hypothetical protein